jgi:DNA end-binding protein Ku
VAPRAYWKGYLKLSLVSCPIALYPATSEREKISFHQLNRKTGHRIRYRKVDAETGHEVESSDIIKGHEVAKGEYIELDPEELGPLRLQASEPSRSRSSTPKLQIDELYIRDPYYIAPDGEVGQQAFAVIREAIRKEGMVAIGRVVFTSREHIIALEARDKGMVGITLRYPYEVRKEKDYFEDIKDEKIPGDMLDLALHIVETKRGDFDPEKFEDQYEDALKELLRKKQKGEKIERPKEPTRSNVVNLMDALRHIALAARLKIGLGQRGQHDGARHKLHRLGERLLSSIEWSLSRSAGSKTRPSDAGQVVAIQRSRCRGICAEKNQGTRGAASGPPLTVYTPSEIRPMAIQSTAEGHSPRIGIASSAVIAGVSATNAAPRIAPRRPTMRP